MPLYGTKARREFLRRYVVAAVSRVDVRGNPSTCDFDCTEQMAGGPSFLITSNLEGALPFRVVCERVGVDALLLSRPRSDFHLKHLAVVDPHGSGFAESIRPKAAPRPVFGLAHQSAFHRIAMHVAQLLDALALRPDIKIVETALPDFSRGPVP